MVGVSVWIMFTDTCAELMITRALLIDAVVSNLRLTSSLALLLSALQPSLTLLPPVFCQICDQENTDAFYLLPDVLVGAQQLFSDPHFI